MSESVFTMDRPASNPEEFLKIVSESVKEHLQTSIKIGLKSDLLEVLRTKRLGDIPDAQIDDVCARIFEKCSPIFDKNLDKFKLYAARNIFAPAAPGSSSSSATTPNTTDEELLHLRAQYLNLQAELLALEDSRRDTDLLLKDMRSTMFELRVGAQAFDEGDIQPIAETVANITQHREKLLQMCVEATEILSRLDESRKVGEASGHPTGEAMDVVDTAEPTTVIETQDLDDILMISKSLRK